MESITLVFIAALPCWRYASRWNATRTRSNAFPGCSKHLLPRPHFTSLSWGMT
jgi:hypothetical protein